MCLCVQASLSLFSLADLSNSTDIQKITQPILFSDVLSVFGQAIIGRNHFDFAAIIDDMFNGSQ